MAKYDKKYELALQLINVERAEQEIEYKPGSARKKPSQQPWMIFPGIEGGKYILDDLIYSGRNPTIQ